MVNNKQIQRQYCKYKTKTFLFACSLLWTNLPFCYKQITATTINNSTEIYRHCILVEIVDPKNEFKSIYIIDVTVAADAAATAAAASQLTSYFIYMAENSVHRKVYYNQTILDCRHRIRLFCPLLCSLLCCMCCNVSSLHLPSSFQFFFIIENLCNQTDIYEVLMTFKDVTVKIISQDSECNYIYVFLSFSVSLSLSLCFFRLVLRCVWLSGFHKISLLCCTNIWSYL